MPAVAGGIGIKLEMAKKSFFESDMILRMGSQANKLALKKAGGLVRRIARNSIRKIGKKRKPSEPGNPPKSRTGLLKDFIFFVYEQQAENVLIGAARLNQTLGTAPHALEVGGRSLTNRGTRRNKRIVSVNIKARPFMAPALQDSLPKLPPMWANSLKKAG